MVNVRHHIAGIMWQFNWTDNQSTSLLKYTDFAYCYVVIFFTVFSRRRTCFFPRNRDLSYYFIHCVGLKDSPFLDMIALRAREGHRCNGLAKSFVEQLEGTSSSVLLDPVGQTKKAQWEKHTMHSVITSDFFSRFCATSLKKC